MEQLTLKSKSGWTGFLTWLDSPDGWARWCRRPSPTLWWRLSLASDHGWRFGSGRSPSVERLRTYL